MTKNASPCSPLRSSLACLAAGSAIGALAGSIPLLMVSRLIEGVGIGLIGVAAPTCVSVWFPPKQRGLALGLWATWVPLGCVLMFNIAAPMAGGNPDKVPSGAQRFIELCEEAGYLGLPLSPEAIIAYEKLDIERAEGIHKDPFDRMLIAQSKVAKMLLITHDRSFSLYDEPLVIVV